MKTCFKVYDGWHGVETRDAGASEALVVFVPERGDLWLSDEVSCEAVFVEGTATDVCERILEYFHVSRDCDYIARFDCPDGDIPLGGTVRRYFNDDDKDQIRFIGFDGQTVVLHKDAALLMARNVLSVSKGEHFPGSFFSDVIKRSAYMASAVRNALRVAPRRDLRNQGLVDAYRSFEKYYQEVLV